MTAIIERLPEELLLHVFEYLDSPAPSERNARREPNLDLTEGDGEAAAYNCVSRTSKRWRRIVLPLLFRYTRLELQNMYSTTSNAETLNAYVSFVQVHNLAVNVASLVLIAPNVSHEERPHSHSEAKIHFQTTAELWRQLFANLPCLLRVVMLASPEDLGYLTGCSVDCSDPTASWAFSDMNYHTLTLSMPPSSLVEDIRVEAPTSHLPATPTGTTPSSILYRRPWTNLALNEGSFLKAYGTYEYFERGPPSLIDSIKASLASTFRIRGSTNVHPISIRSLTYTAILPFANHLDFRRFLPYLDELDIQLAPDPSSSILNDKDRVGKAELEDCWQELFTAYRFITRPFRTFEIKRDGTPRLKKFVCRDMQIAALRPDLDEEFVPLCLPLWAEMQPGVFERLQDALTADYFSG